MSPLGAARAIITAGGAVDLGKLELIETKTLSTAAAEFTSLDVSTYNVHLFVYSDLITPA